MPFNSLNIISVHIRRRSGVFVMRFYICNIET
nr:MAG TPA: hypothetical protein [Caudoviricetes sp.]